MLLPYYLMFIWGYVISCSRSSPPHWFVQTSILIQALWVICLLVYLFYRIYCGFRGSLCRIVSQRVTLFSSQLHSFLPPTPHFRIRKFPLLTRGELSHPYQCSSRSVSIPGTYHDLFLKKSAHSLRNILKNAISPFCAHAYRVYTFTSPKWDRSLNILL